MGKFPRETTSQATGRQAEIWFAHKFQTWICIPTGATDFGIDFRVELTENEEVSGLEFIAQVKGSRRTNIRSNGRVSVNIDQRTVNYWLMKLQPCLIVHVDLTSEEFWCSWLSDAYEHFPELSDEDRTVCLTLNPAPQLDCLLQEVRHYVEAHHSRLKRGLEELLPNKLLHIIATHTSELYRLLSDMAIAVARADPGARVAPEEQIDGWLLQVGFHSSGIQQFWELRKASYQPFPEINEQVSYLIGQIREVESRWLKIEDMVRNSKNLPPQEYGAPLRIHRMPWNQDLMCENILETRDAVFALQRFLIESLLLRG